MTPRSLKSLLHRWHSSLQDQTPGFTLAELLVGTVIAGIVVSGLLYMTTQLVQTNQKQSAQSETQRDMQTALDYINSELRNAVYVYEGNCLQGVANTCGIVNHIPAQNNSIPVLAFWKLDPLPAQLINVCNADKNTDPNVNPNSPIVRGVPCFAGQTYTLVVYFLSKDTTATNWQGKARITRYALTEYNTNTTAPYTPNPGYVDPTQPGTNFNSWPYQTNVNNTVDLQTTLPTGGAVALVDFVDDTARANAGDDSVTCPNNNNNNYAITPSVNSLNSNTSFTFTTSDKQVRSFYACVRQGAAFNQDVIVFLRGNAYGRPGIGGMSDTAFLPTMQTQVLNRGDVNTVPTALK